MLVFLIWRLYNNIDNISIINMSLKKYRKQLDKIDDKIVNLLAKRMKLASQIGKHKFGNGMKIFQPSREDVVKDKLKSLADKFNLNFSFLSKIWNEIISESIKIQEKIFEKKNN